MTDALKRMVEAMGTEFARQRENYDVDWAHGTGGLGGAEWHLDGRFDLEKVARAGLEAIKDEGLPR